MMDNGAAPQNQRQALNPDDDDNTNEAKLVFSKQRVQKEFSRPRSLWRDRDESFPARPALLESVPQDVWEAFVQALHGRLRRFQALYQSAISVFVWMVLALLYWADHRNKKSSSSSSNDDNNGGDTSEEEPVSPWHLAWMIVVTSLFVFGTLWVSFVFFHNVALWGWSRVMDSFVFGPILETWGPTFAQDYGLQVTYESRSVPGQFRYFPTVIKQIIFRRVDRDATAAPSGTTAANTKENIFVPPTIV